MFDFSEDEWVFTVAACLGALVGGAAAVSDADASFWAERQREVAGAQLRRLPGCFTSARDTTADSWIFCGGATASLTSDERKSLHEDHRAALPFRYATRTGLPTKQLKYNAFPSCADPKVL